MGEVEMMNKKGAPKIADSYEQAKNPKVLVN